MIDVERLQRLNQLTNELMHHGIVTDREVAMRQANMMINKGSERDMFNGTAPQQHVSIQPMQMTPPMQHASPQGTFPPASASAMMQSSSAEHPQQGGYIPDWSTLYRKVEQRITEQNGQINFLTSQLKQMQSELTELRKAPRQVIVERHVSAQETPTAMQTPQMHSPPAASAVHAETARPQPQVIDANTGRPVAFEQMGERKSPRTGGYRSEDVSIEKFFYAAGKGK